MIKNSFLNIFLLNGFRLNQLYSLLIIKQQIKEIKYELSFQFLRQADQIVFSLFYTDLTNSHVQF